MRVSFETACLCPQCLTSVTQQNELEKHRIATLLVTGPAIRSVSHCTFKSLSPLKSAETIVSMGKRHGHGAAAAARQRSVTRGHY